MFIMKTKKIITTLLAIAIVTTFVISAFAATLSDVNPSFSAEVKANIVDPGSISYGCAFPCQISKIKTVHELSKPDKK